MKKSYLIFTLLLALGLLSLPACDRVSNPYPPVVNLELDTTLYPGNWANYVANEWPTFTTNTNTDRNVLIEDFTGHKCIFCPAAADLAHQLHEANPNRVFVASIHSGVDGIGDFQSVDPEYTLDFTNQDGLGTDSHPEANFWPVHHLVVKAFENEGVVFSEVFIDKTFPHENAPVRVVVENQD